VIAREELLAKCPVQLGISQNVLAFAPDRIWHPLDRALTRLAGYNYNHAFIEALTTGKLRLSFPGVASVKLDIPGAKDSSDFVGVNYYTRAHLRFVTRKPFVQFNYRDVNKRALTDIGWEDYPEGFLQLLVEMKRYHLPVWITENGIDDRKGDRRPQYLHAHWGQLLEAINAASTFAATSTGACSTTSSGSRAGARASGSIGSTSRRSSARPRRPARTFARSPSAQADRARRGEREARREVGARGRCLTRPWTKPQTPLSRVTGTSASMPLSRAFSRGCAQAGGARAAR